ncbi:MAG: HAMP domain-containing sensor histidine kinase [Chloroflexota bacterium]
MENINILILEDKQDDIDLLLLELDRSDINYTCSYAETREEFLNKISPEIDVVLSDYNMPQFQAPDALQLLKSLEIDIPLIVVTGSISEEVAVACMRDGAADYLLKDRLSRLGEAIRQAIEKRALVGIQREAEILRIELEKERELRALKSRFVSMIVHDFRNPLAAIKIAADYLQYGNTTISESKREEKLDAILNRVSHLSRLVDDVLLIGEMDSVERDFSPSFGNLVDFSEQFFADFVTQIDRAQFKTGFSVSGSPQEVQFDQKWIERAYENLLSNAIKYSPNGGNIKMELEFNRSEVKIAISDEGIGVAIQDQKRIFESFHRAENVGNFQGSGLGLAIVKQVADLHGGRVEFSSEEDVGSTFILGLPYSPQNNSTYP